MGLAVSWINGRDFWVECLAGGVLGCWWVGCFSGGGRCCFLFVGFDEAEIYLVLAVV